MRFGRKRRPRINNFGTTEEYEARQLKRAAPTVRQQMMSVAQPDPRITALYRECKKMNDEDQFPCLPGADVPDPYEVDHIRTSKQGGKHVYENLHIIRRHKNRGVTERTEEEIEQTTRILALTRKGGF